MAYDVEVHGENYMDICGRLNNDIKGEKDHTSALAIAKAPPLDGWLWMFVHGQLNINILK